MFRKSLYILILSCFFQPTYAADLLEVYLEAQRSDPVFQQAVAQRLSTKLGVQISLAQILPNISGYFNPSLTRTGVSGTNLASFAGVGIAPRNTTTRAYTLALNITQTIFDFGQFMGVASAHALSKGADATLNAALQNLMTRVSTAYFNVLKDEDNLSYNAASKRAYKEQLDQIRHQYRVGLKTTTDVYTAQASYDLAVANYIAAQTTLNNDRENLRVITGRYYDHLAPLSENFPLVSPEPNDIETWVKTAESQNWSIKTQQYNVTSYLQIMRQQMGGYLPTVSLQGTMDRLYSLNINGYNTLTDRKGPATQTDRQVAFIINLPIFSGGAVSAQTAQAKYNYQVAQAQLEQTVRDTVNTTRQSYLGIMLGISQVKSDRQAIRSTRSSLQGLEAGYRVGTQTLVDVLNQQQKVLQAQTQYATDRYNFVNNILALKQAAGTLGFDDLRAINDWLLEPKSK